MQHSSEFTQLTCFCLSFLFRLLGIGGTVSLLSMLNKGRVSKRHLAGDGELDTASCGTSRLPQGQGHLFADFPSLRPETAVLSFWRLHHRLLVTQCGVRFKPAQALTVLLWAFGLGHYLSCSCNFFHSKHFHISLQQRFVFVYG